MGSTMAYLLFRPPGETFSLSLSLLYLTQIGNGNKEFKGKGKRVSSMKYKMQTDGRQSRQVKVRCYSSSFELEVTLGPVSDSGAKV